MSKKRAISTVSVKTVVSCSDSPVNFYSGSTLDLINGKIDRVSFTSARINDMNLKIDVDMSSHKADT
ncbi:MAG: hypothetical protein GX568_09140, partial [Candidatus Gastranaerophilales bacterium]|nr:hypothetical protein [Candidatus Gastranaerophilales bacterium]